MNRFRVPAVDSTIRDLLTPVILNGNRNYNQWGSDCAQVLGIKQPDSYITDAIARALGRTVWMDIDTRITEVWVAFHTHDMGETPSGVVTNDLLLNHVTFTSA